MFGCLLRGSCQYLWYMVCQASQHFNCVLFVSLMDIDGVSVFKPVLKNFILLKTKFYHCLQVKNFGRSGRTKYTHLLDQDTTHFDSPWIADTVQNLKFHTAKGGGTKQVFERPSMRSVQK